ncbi:MAG: transcriptional regulator [Chlorobiales bacterium]|nr:transcriptional regulator [Chlorobiales bacterium]
MPISGPYNDEAKRLKGEIKKKFKTQVALCQAIGAKDASYITAYVSGKHRIGNILRDKLEAVGIDVAYVLYGKRGFSPVPTGPDPEVMARLRECTDKLRALQNTVIDLNKELLDVNRMLEDITKKLNA